MTFEKSSDAVKNATAGAARGDVNPFALLIKQSDKNETITSPMTLPLSETFYYLEWHPLLKMDWIYDQMETGESAVTIILLEVVHPIVWVMHKFIETL